MNYIEQVAEIRRILDGMKIGIGNEPPSKAKEMAEALYKLVEKFAADICTGKLVRVEE